MLEISQIERKELLLNKWYCEKASIQGKSVTWYFFYKGTQSCFGFYTDDFFQNIIFLTCLNIDKFTNLKIAENIDILFSQYARKKGFLPGAKMKDKDDKTFVVSELFYNNETNVFLSGRDIVFSCDTGNWATLDKAEITIGGYDVKFKLDFFHFVQVEINGKIYLESDFDAVKKIIKKGCKIMVGHNHKHELTLETVNKVLKKINEEYDKFVRPEL